MRWVRRAATIVLGFALILPLLVLSVLNPTPVEFHVTPTWQVNASVGALVAGSFLIGALFVILFASLTALRRGITGWSLERRRRKTRRIDEWELRGEQLVWQGDVQRGRALMQKVLQRRPEDSRAVLALASSYRDTGELHRARGVLYDAATQNHTDPEVLYALAEAHLASGEIGPHIEVLERLRALFPRAPRALRSLRDAYEAAGRWYDAMTLQEALLNEIRDPEGLNRETRRLLALRYQVAFNLPDATSRLRRLEALSEGRAPSLPLMVSVGDSLLASGRKDEASVLWERALRSTPRTVLVERLIGIASEPKHRERLRSILRKLRGDQVTTESVQLWTARLFLDDGNTDAAAKELASIPVGPDSPDLLHQLTSEIHRNRGQIDQALKSASELRRRDHYQCLSCGQGSADWIAYCPRCHEWDSYRSAAEIAVR